MSKILDARGWECPKPVLETKKALQTEDSLTVIVDSRAARENVARLAGKSGCRVGIEEKDDGVYLTIEKEAGTTKQKTPEPQTESRTADSGGKLVLMIASDIVGSGNDELGTILMRAFMATFLEIQPHPDTIIFINNGVKLAISNSPVLDDLQSLAEEGVEILVCGTCLKYFNLTDEIAAGEISNAYTIAETMLQAGKIVRL